MSYTRLAPIFGTNERFVIAAAAAGGGGGGDVMYTAPVQWCSGTERAVAPWLSRQGAQYTASPKLFYD